MIGFGGYLRQEENGGQLLAEFSNPPDLVEQFTVQGKCFDDEAEEKKECNTGIRLPMLSSKASADKSQIPPMLLDSVIDIQASWSKVSSILFELARVALNVSLEEFTQLIDGDARGVRFAHYFPCQRPELVNDKQMRYGAHTDSGGFTCLFLDPENPDGLQVKLPSTGEWLDVPHVHESFIINVGEIMSSWTGRFWKAPVHQVTMGDCTRSRLSIVLGSLAPRVGGPDIETFSSHSVPDDIDHLGKVNVGDFLAYRANLHQDQGKVKTQVSILSI